MSLGLIRFLTLLIIINHLAMANSKIDSLNAELSKNPNLKTKIDIFNKLGKYTLPESKSKAMIYLDKALNLSLIVNYKKGLIDNYYQRGVDYYNNDDFNKTKTYFFQALKLSDVSGNTAFLPDIYNILAYIYKVEIKYNSAIKCYNDLGNFFLKSGNKKGLAMAYINLGNVYYLYKNNLYKSLQMYFIALNYARAADDIQKTAYCYVNIGLIDMELKKFEDAKKYMFMALEINKKLGKQPDIANNIANISKIYQDKNILDSSMYYHQLSYEIASKYGLKELMSNNLSDIGYIYYTRNEYSKALESYEKARSIDSAINNLLSLAFNNKDIAKILISNNNNIERAINYLQKSMEYAKSTDNYKLLKEIYETYMNYYQKQNDFNNAYKYSLLFTSVKDSLLARDIVNEIGKLEGKYEMEGQLNEQKRIAEANEKQNKLELIVSIFGSAFLVFFIIILWRQRLITEKLLINILPISIAKRLKRKSNYIADNFDEATVIFIDIVDFTLLSSNAKPENIVEILNKIFTTFDHIAENYNMEKIKTIGDCYMAASGIPLKRPDHAEVAALMSIEALDAMKDYKVTLQLNDNTVIENVSIKFKIGIDTGPIVAGVIGEKKFIYDLWGDTVNTASRMVENGVTDKIQVTERFKNTLTLNPSPPGRGQGEGFKFIERGEIEIKGKGIMRTWFLENI